MQPEINVGSIGHVDHGKSSLIGAITGMKTDKHSEEIKRGITIKLGYADASIRKCDKCKTGYTTKETCPRCGNKTRLIRKISFLDSPGHETLMATVIAASSIMDAALFVIAANEKCPQPQTLEHLMILEASSINTVIIAQNKIDLVDKQRALENYREIKEFLKGTRFENAPIIPTSANALLNTDAVIQAIQDIVPTPVRVEGKDARLYAARSFDVNKPGSEMKNIVGGVIGGSIVQGKLSKGDEIEILPGSLRIKNKKEVYEPLFTKITSLHAGGEELQEAKPGGLIGIATTLDPSLLHGDNLVGCVVGEKGKLPPVWNELAVEITPVKRLAQTFSPGYTPNEPLVLGVGTATTLGFVIEQKKKVVKLLLKKPICAERGANLAVMRRSSNRWHLYGVSKIP